MPPAPAAPARRALLPVYVILLEVAWAGAPAAGACAQASRHEVDNRSAPQTRDAAGYVVEQRGRWAASFAGATRPLRVGAAVFAGDTIQAEADAERGRRIAIALRADSALSITCPDAEDPQRPLACEALVVRGGRPVGATRLGRVLRETMQRIAGHEPQRYTSLVSRGGNQPADAVALIRSARADLHAVFAGVDSGHYELCLVRFARPDSAGAAASDASTCDARLPYDWRPGHPEAAHVGPLKPGLYALTLTSRGDSGTAWLLLCDSRTFPAMERRFAAVRRATSAWGSELQPAAQRVERAYLVTLANSEARR